MHNLRPRVGIKVQASTLCAYNNIVPGGMVPVPPPWVNLAIPCSLFKWIFFSDMWASQCDTVIRVRTAEVITIKTTIRGALLWYEDSPRWRAEGWTDNPDRARRELPGIYKVNCQDIQDENTLKPYK